MSAFEAVNDDTLARLDKGHTTADAARAVAILRAHGIEVRPSFMPFTPWTTLDDVRALLAFVAEHDLVENVDPVQYTIRLLIPQGSLVLELPDLAPRWLGPYDDARGTLRVDAPDPALDELQARLAALVEDHVAARHADPRDLRGGVRRGRRVRRRIRSRRCVGRPRLTEPWFCCAEPTAQQFTRRRPNAAR